MIFYTTVTQQNVHFTTKFCAIISENDKVMLSEPRKLPISQCSSIMQKCLARIWIQK